jgi:hypothetical protein
LERWRVYVKRAPGVEAQRGRAADEACVAAGQRAKKKPRTRRGFLDNVLRLSV